MGRKRNLFALLGPIAVTLALVVGGAAGPTRVAAAEGHPHPVTIDVKDADIHNVFRLLARVSGTNIVVADGVTGRVTIRLVDVPWADAFNAVLVAEHLGVTRVGDILVVDTLQHITQRAKEGADAARSGAKAAPLRTILVPVNYANAEDLARIISSVLSERGSVVVDTRTNTLIVTDVDDSLTRVQGLTE